MVTTETALSTASLSLDILRIGLWEDDVAADRIRFDAVMAAMYGVSEAEAAHGFSWAHLSSLFHPDDVALDPDRHRRVRENGGLIVWEHRILPASGDVRWVLARGHFARDPDGRMRGRGIIIDITGSRTDGVLAGPANFLTAYEGSGALLDRIADQAIDMFDMVQALERERSTKLRPLFEAFLHELGRQLAKTMQEDALVSGCNNRKIH